MKKIFLLLLVVLGIDPLIAQPSASSTIAPVTTSSHDRVTPPTVVTNRFFTDYPNIKPVWYKDGENYLVEYKDEKTNMGQIIIYNKIGYTVRMDREMDKLSYPPAINNYYFENFPNDTYKIWLSEDNNGNRTYYSKHISGTIWFDKNGNWLPSKSIKYSNVNK